MSAALQLNLNSYTRIQIAAAVVSLLQNPSLASSSCSSSGSHHAAVPTLQAAWGTNNRTLTSTSAKEPSQAAADHFGPPPALQQRRVVVTGIGMVTPLGVGVQDSWQGLIAGRTGVRRLQPDDLPEVCSAFAASSTCAQWGRSVGGVSVVHVSKCWGFFLQDTVMMHGLNNRSCALHVRDSCRHWL